MGPTQSMASTALGNRVRPLEPSTVSAVDQPSEKSAFEARTVTWGTSSYGHPVRGSMMWLRYLPAMIYPRRELPLVETAPCASSR